MTQLDNALVLARVGWHVFPVWHVNPDRSCACCNPERGQIGKHPRCLHGHNDATTDEAKIRRWWSAEAINRTAPDAWECCPDSNIGIAVPDGIVIVDIDPRNGGEATFAAICDAHGDAWTQTMLVQSGGGGVQLYFSCEPGRRFPKTLDAHFGKGIDLKQCGGYVLAPGSNHKSGGTYEWGTEAPILPAPAWLMELSEVSRVRQQRATHTLAVADVAELDDDLRGRLDTAIAIIEPEYALGRRHNLALAIGGYFKNKGLPPLAARYVVSQLPSADTASRVDDALDAYDMEHPAGANAIREIEPELLAQLDELELGSSSGLREWRERRAAARAAAAEDGANQQAERAEYATDLGNARRLVRLHGDRLKHCSERDVWLTWDGMRWADDRTGEAMRAAKASAESLWDEVPDAEDRKEAAKRASNAQSAKALAAALALAKTEPSIVVSVAELDRDPWLLNVQNGTLDLRTGELLAPNPALLMTKCCATAYDANARSELWDGFVATTFGGDADLAAYVQRALGYALFGAWREKMFWFGYGPPDGAKSTALGVVGRVLGDYHVSVDPETWMHRHNIGGNRGDLTRLLGARLATSLEIRPGLKFDAQLMKRVTGGDTIVAAAKYEGEIQFPPTFALWFGANDRPIIPDDDDGFWNRVRCVPFTNVVPPEKQDKALAEKLSGPEHAPAVLAWLVAGCLAWQREGIGTCTAVETATRTYRTDMNRAAAFFAECCELTNNNADEVPRKAMRQAYVRWAEENGVRNPLTDKELGQRLRALGVCGEENKRQVRPAFAGAATGAQLAFAGRDRHWLGVRLRVE